MLTSYFAANDSLGGDSAILAAGEGGRHGTAQEGGVTEACLGGRHGSEPGWPAHREPSPGPSLVAPGVAQKGGHLSHPPPLLLALHDGAGNDMQSPGGAARTESPLQARQEEGAASVNGVTEAAPGAHVVASLAPDFHVVASPTPNVNLVASPAPDVNVVASSAAVRADSPVLVDAAAAPLAERESLMSSLDLNVARSTPLVLQCSACRLIVGDTFSIISLNYASKTITLSDKNDNVVCEEALHTSLSGDDFGSTFHLIRCTKCAVALGRMYRTTSPELDHWRMHYTFSTEALCYYKLSQRGLSAARKAAAKAQGSDGRPVQGSAYTLPGGAAPLPPGSSSLASVEITKLQKFSLFLYDRVAVLEDEMAAIKAVRAKSDARRRAASHHQVSFLSTRGASIADGEERHQGAATAPLSERSASSESQPGLGDGTAGSGNAATSAEGPFEQPSVKVKRGPGRPRKTPPSLPAEEGGEGESRRGEMLSSSHHNRHSRGEGDQVVEQRPAAEDGEHASGSARGAAPEVHMRGDGHTASSSSLKRPPAEGPSSEASSHGGVSSLMEETTTKRGPGRPRIHPIGYTYPRSRRGRHQGSQSGRKASKSLHGRLHSDEDDEDFFCN